MITQMKLKRMRGFVGKNGRLHATFFEKALPRMKEERFCPCHNVMMTFSVSDGQAINLYKECRRQVEAGNRDL